VKTVGFGIKKERSTMHLRRFRDPDQEKRRRKEKEDINKKIFQLIRQVEWTPVTSRSQRWVIH